MTPREWPFPDKLTGVNLAIAADPQLGRRDWTANHVERAGVDLDEIQAYVDAYIHVGDIIHWGQPQSQGPEDNQGKAWFDARYAATGKPWVIVAGNHDLSSFSDPYPDRSAQEWATTYGLASPNKVIDVGPIRVIGISPSRWASDAGAYGLLELFSSDLEWLDRQLHLAGDRKCWIVCHTALPEHYPGQMVDNVSEIVGAHSNVVGWISGHRHLDTVEDLDNHMQTITVGGRQIFSISCPSSGGLTRYSVNDPWDNHIMSVVVTYLPGLDTVEVRWRDHKRKQWGRSLGEKMRTLTRVV